LRSNLEAAPRLGPAERGPARKKKKKKRKKERNLDDTLDFKKFQLKQTDDEQRKKMQLSVQCSSVFEGNSSGSSVFEGNSSGSSVFEWSSSGSSVFDGNSSGSSVFDSHFADHRRAVNMHAMLNVQGRRGAVSVLPTHRLLIDPPDTNAVAFGGCCS
jgi:hypothetical protein